MSRRLRSALERLESALTRSGYPLVDGLRPGLSEDEVRRRLAGLNVDPPEDVVTLFGWHDGYEAPAGNEWHGRINPAFKLLSLDQACAYHATTQDVLHAASEYTGEATEWFPLFSSDSAVFCVINYGDDPATRGQVATFDGGDLEPAPSERPLSLADPIERWADYFEAATWQWDGTRWHDTRDDAERSAHPWTI